jgi:hypothetical protein
MTQTCTDLNPSRSPVVARFERWLRRRGYEPMFDPFAPEPDGSAEAAALVLEYLIDRPEDAAGQALLLRHACEVGGVYALGS